MSAGGAGGVFSGLTSGVMKIAVGQGQLREGRRLLNRLGEMPNQTIPQEVLENKTNAEIAAREGMPSAQYAQAMRNIQRQQASAIQAGQNRRMAGSLIGGIQQNTNSANLNLDVANANARMKNQAKLASANNNIGMWRNRIYENYINKKYIPEQNYARSLQGAGNANRIAGIDSVMGSVGGMGGMMGGGGSPGGGGSFGGAGASGSW